MSTLDNIKNLFKAAKEKFDAPPAPPAAAPAAPAAPVVPAGTPYTLQDGSTISIVQAGATPAVGDMVMVNGVAAPAGDLVLQDGSVITVDATGAITAYTPLAPATTDIPAAAAAPAAAPVVAPAVPAKVAAASDKGITPAQMSEMVNKFANGSDEERLVNLEAVCKALMQSEFGWQILEQQRLADTNNAIAIYNTTLKMHSDKVEAAEARLAKQDEVIKALFDLVEEMSNMPSAEPKTLTGNKKDQFDRTNKKEAKMEKIAAAVAQMKKEKASGVPA